MHVQYITEYIDGWYHVTYVEFDEDGNAQSERRVKTTKSRQEAWYTAERLNKLPQNYEQADA